MKSKTKNKKILAAIAAFTLIGFVLYLAQSFMGNPVSKMMVKDRAKKYIQREYKDLNLELGEPIYNSKVGRYTVDAKSPTSRDTYFEINFTGLGKFEFDSYEDMVSNKWNTLQRIDKEYRSLVEGIFEDNFPYKTSIYYGEFVKTNSNFSHLEVDKEYDIKELAREDGGLILYVESDVIDNETLSKLLLEVKEIFDEKNLPFQQIDLTLEEPRVDGLPGDERREVINFLYKDIYIEGLEERVEENIKSSKEFY